MYRLTFVALAFFLFLPASTAYAQIDDLVEVIQEFCDDVGEATGEALEGRNEAKRDLQRCLNLFMQCRGGSVVGSATVRCVGDLRRCTERANGDKLELCSTFLSEFGDAFNDALREADLKDVDDLFLISPIVQEKVDAAVAFAGRCTANTDDPPPAPDESNVCDSAGCMSSEDRSVQCEAFLGICPDDAPEGYCVAGGLAICQDIVPPEDADEGLCTRELCALSEDLAAQCKVGLSACLATEPGFNEDECLAAALLFCRS